MNIPAETKPASAYKRRWRRTSVVTVGNDRYTVYTFQVTMGDAGGLTATSSIAVTVVRVEVQPR